MVTTKEVCLSSSTTANYGLLQGKALGGGDSIPGSRLTIPHVEGQEADAVKEAPVYK